MNNSTCHLRPQKKASEVDGLRLVVGEARRRGGMSHDGVRIGAGLVVDRRFVGLGEDANDGEGRYTSGCDLLPELRRVNVGVSHVGEHGAVLAGSGVAQAVNRLKTLDHEAPIAAPTSAQWLEFHDAFEHGVIARTLTLRTFRRQIAHLPQRGARR